jgi:hypothetical protein
MAEAPGIEVDDEIRRLAEEHDQWPALEQAAMVLAQLRKRKLAQVHSG